MGLLPVAYFLNLIDEGPFNQDEQEAIIISVIEDATDNVRRHLIGLPPLRALLVDTINAHLAPQMRALVRRQEIKKIEEEALVISNNLTQISVKSSLSLDNAVDDYYHQEYIASLMHT